MSFAVLEATFIHLYYVNTTGFTYDDRKNWKTYQGPNSPTFCSGEEEKKFFLNTPA
jgi:hypothetical protein